MLNLDNLEPDKKNSKSSENISQDTPQVSLVNPSQNSTEKSEEFNPKTQKYIYIKPVDQNFKVKLKKTIDDLVAIRLDIFNKKVEIVNKQNLIKEKIDFLNESKKVRIDKAAIERSEKSALSYTRLLDGIINELSREIAYYNIFLTDEKPPQDKIVAPLQAPDKIEDFLELQLNGVKRHLKHVKRDIAISFSRYTFGFDEQLKHLTYVESFIKSKEVPAQAPKNEEK